MANTNQVQGAHSKIEDLVLTADGTSVVEHLGAGILPTPKLERTIFGADTIELEVLDPEREVLKSELLSTQWDAEIDGLGFRYPGVLHKQGENLTIVLEDKWVKLLKEAIGPKQGRRSQMTRAEFIKSCVEEAAPGLKFICPRLEEKQPIAKKKKTKSESPAKAKSEAEEELGKGITSASELTVAGEQATPEQKEIGDRALRVAAGTEGITQTVEEALMCALMDESGLGKLTGGKNVLEAEGSEGAVIGDVLQEVTDFLTGSGGYVKGGAIGVAKENPGYTPPQIATTTQRNATFLSGGLSEGEKPYARFTKEAHEWVMEMGGGEAAGGEITTTKAYLYKIEKKENYWKGIKKLASEVNWRLFILGDRCFYMPETEIAQGMVWLLINDEVLDDPDSGVENVDFEYDGNNPVTEIEITALIEQFGCDPGKVIVLADHGPASIGFGEAPTTGGGNAISQVAVPALTLEGKARYIVTDIEVPLVNEPAQRLATIKARKPTAPLPEPRAETQSTSVKGPTAEIPADAPPAVAKLIAEIEATNGTFTYKWGGGHESVKALHERLKGYDCSGYVSHDLWAAGLLEEPLTSGAFESWGEAGKGEWITIYCNAEHAFGEVKTASGWRFFESGGQANATGWVPEGQEDPLGNYTARHPKGL